MKYSFFDITLYGGNCLVGELFFLPVSCSSCLKTAVAFTVPCLPSTGFPGFSECGCISAYICTLRLLKIGPLFLRLALVQNSGIIFSMHIAAQRLALRTDTLDAVVGGSWF